MHMVIGNCLLVLRHLTDYELEQLITTQQMRLARVNDELESLVGERIRRRPVPGTLF